MNYFQLLLGLRSMKNLRFSNQSCGTTLLQIGLKLKFWAHFYGSFNLYLQFFKFLRFSKILSLKSWLKIVWLTQKSLFCNSLILKIHYPTHSCQKWSKQTTFIIQILANFWGPEVVGSSFYQKSICMPVLHFHVSFMG